MLRDFYGTVGGEQWQCSVMLTQISGHWAMQCAVHRVNRWRGGDACTHPRYVCGRTFDRIEAGLRNPLRMPSWMLADVLQECGIPDHMCDVVRNAELDQLQWPFCHACGMTRTTCHCKS